MSEGKSNFKSVWTWFRQTATIIGIPVTLLICMIGVQKIFFTTTCSVAGYKCEYAIGEQSQDNMAKYVGDLLESNPGMDLVAKPHSHK